MSGARLRWSAGKGKDKKKMCEHKEFKSSGKINRFADRTEMLAEIRIRCAECDESVQFLGLPAGLALRGAAVSPDGIEARLAIIPKGALLS